MSTMLEQVATMLLAEVETRASALSHATIDKLTLERNDARIQLENKSQALRHELVEANKFMRERDAARAELEGARVEARRDLQMEVLPITMRALGCGRAESVNEAAERVVKERDAARAELAGVAAQLQKAHEDIKLEQAARRVLYLLSEDEIARLRAIVASDDEAGKENAKLAARVTELEARLAAAVAP
jgi:hypothetical protein